MQRDSVLSSPLVAAAARRIAVGLVLLIALRLVQLLVLLGSGGFVRIGTGLAVFTIWGLALVVLIRGLFGLARHGRERRTVALAHTAALLLCAMLAVMAWSVIDLLDGSSDAPPPAWARLVAGMVVGLAEMGAMLALLGSIRAVRAGVELGPDRRLRAAFGVVALALLLRGLHGLLALANPLDAGRGLAAACMVLEIVALALVHGRCQRLAVALEEAVRREAARPGAIP